MSHASRQPWAERSSRRLDDASPPPHRGYDGHRRGTSGGAASGVASSSARYGASRDPPPAYDRPRDDERAPWPRERHGYATHSSSDSSAYARTGDGRRVGDERRQSYQRHDRRSSRERRSRSPRSRDGSVNRHRWSPRADFEEGEIHREDAREDARRRRSPPSPLAQDQDYDYDLDPEEQQRRLIEERRKRRQAILAKHQGAASPSTPLEANGKAVSLAGSERGRSEERSRAGSTARSVSPAALDSVPSGGAFSLAKAGEEIGPAPAALPQSRDTGAKEQAEVSAADYDPTRDRAEDDERERAYARIHGAGPNGSHAGTNGPANGNGPAVATTTTAARRDGDEESEYEEIEVTDDEAEEDMFAIADNAEGSGGKKTKKIRVKKGSRNAPGGYGGAGAAAEGGETGGVAAAPALEDNWDDEDGYYRVVLGERLGEDGRYHVFANLGKGMFSSVVKAKDRGPANARVPEGHESEVAIKIVRIQETMYKAGIKEIGILRKLAELDPEDKRHLIRLVGHFDHRGHLCMVFESMSMNLREVIKRFGKDVGLNLRAVRAYAHQMFLALALMKKAGVMHADIKPDNILVNEAKTVLKICDLGSASDLSEMEITPYLVSRFYRAPEIILGQAYDCALDVWSIGCTLYELATGKILFPGRSNNQMLLLMQELRGKLTTRQIRKGRFSGMHFDEQNVFLSMERDKSTGQETLRRVATLGSKPVSDVRSRILPGHVAQTLSADELRLHNAFVSLLERTLELDPSRRITPKEALAHPFLA